jgi:hypothetical protein
MIRNEIAAYVHTAQSLHSENNAPKEPIRMRFGYMDVLITKSALIALNVQRLVMAVLLGSVRITPLC